jgi:hypothetical protein
MHNDAVVQGLSEVPFMQDVEHWGVITIGTGLGNARFTNREPVKKKNAECCEFRLHDLHVKELIHSRAIVMRDPPAEVIDHRYRNSPLELSLAACGARRR